MRNIITDNYALQHNIAAQDCKTTLQHNIATWQFCKTTLQDNISAQHCKTTLQDNIARQLCKTTLQDNIARQHGNIAGHILNYTLCTQSSRDYKFIAVREPGWHLPFPLYCIVTLLYSVYPTEVWKLNNQTLQTRKQISFISCSCLKLWAHLSLSS